MDDNMNYHDIPEYESIERWTNANDLLEVKFFDRYGDVVLHLVEDPDHPDDQIQDKHFYVPNDGGSPVWIREREAFEMEYNTGITIDADYVELLTNGERRETQHNVVHLDNNVRNGRYIPLTPA